MKQNFEELLTRVKELDKLKFVLRESDTLDGSRKENSAEHSWQCAMMALLFARYVDGYVDLLKVLTMLVSHDVGEIDARDVGLYGSYDADARFEKELGCVRRLFEESHPELLEAWMEFEDGRTAEAKYARAIDRISGMLSSHFNERSCWSEKGMSAEKILERNSAVQEGLPAIWAMIEKLVREADLQGKIGNKGSADSKREVRR